MAESLTDQVRAMLAENPKIRGGEVARLLDIPNANAHALVNYARRVPTPGGHGGRGGFGGQGGPVPPSGDPRWPTLAAPVLAFLAGSTAGRSHADLKAWRQTVKGMGPTRLANALAWLEGQGLARSEGDRHPNRAHSKASDGASRAHLVRWFGGTPTPAERDFGEY